MLVFTGGLMGIFGKAVLSNALFFGGSSIVGYSGFLGYKYSFGAKFDMIKDLSRHVHCTGDTGTGKSYFSVYKAIETLNHPGRYPLVFLDPNGNMTDTLLAHMPEWRKEDVIIIDPLDYKIVGVNPFTCNSEADIELVVEDIVNIYRHMFKGNAWGDVIESGIKFATRSVIEYSLATDQKIDILDPFLFAIEFDYQKKVLDHVKSFVVEKYWENYNFGTVNPKTGEFKASADYKRLILKLSKSIESQHLMNVLAQRKSIDLVEAIHSNKIIIVKLGGPLGSDNSMLLAGIIFIKIVRSVLAKKINVEFLQIFADEMHRYLGMLGSHLESNLAEIRQFHVGLFLIHQGLFQLEGYGNMIKAIRLCNTRYYFKPPLEEDLSKVFKALGIKDDKDNPMMKRLSYMGVRQHMAIECVGGRLQKPQFKKTPLLIFEEGDQGTYWLKVGGIKEMSRAKYGTYKHIVEKMIEAKVRGMGVLDEDGIVDIPCEVVKDGEDIDNRQGHRNSETDLTFTVY